MDLLNTLYNLMGLVFTPVLHIYWPKREILDGGWKPVRVNKA